MHKNKHTALRLFFTFSFSLFFVSASVCDGEGVPRSNASTNTVNKKIVEKLVRLGARIDRGAHKTVVTLDTVAFFGRHNSWTGDPGDLKGLVAIGSIDALELSMHFGGPGDLEFLQDVLGLRSLSIQVRGGPVWDKDYFKEIVACKELEALVVSSPKLPDDAIQPISRLASLKVLRLNSHKLSRTSLETICKMQSLEQFEAFLVDASDDDLKKFMVLPKLRYLRIQGKGITDSGRKWLVENHPPARACRHFVIKTESFGKAIPTQNEGK